MRDEVILEFKKSVYNDIDNMSYSKEIVKALINEIILMKCKYEGMMLPDDMMGKNNANTM